MTRALLAFAAACAAGALWMGSALAAETSGDKKDESCPRLAVLGDGDHATVFAGAGRDVTDIVHKVTLTGGELTCRHRGEHDLNITVSAIVGVEQGLAAEGDTIEVPFFAAVIDPEELVVTKQDGTATVKIARGNRAGAATVELQTIKLELTPDTLGSDLEVLLSLQLDKDQLAYNRSGH